jgi:hypothetical protein
MDTVLLVFLHWNPVTWGSYWSGEVNGNEHFYEMMSPILEKVDNTAVLLKKY